MSVCVHAWITFACLACMLGCWQALIKVSMYGDARMHVSMHACMYVCMQAWMHTCACMHGCMDVCMCTDIYI